MLLNKTRRERKPGKLVLSPTKIATYLHCPLMYKYIYIDKIGRFYYTPNPGHTLGGSLHRALQDFHESGGTETHSPDQLIERLRNTWVSTGYSGVEDEQAHLDSAVTMLQEYYTAALESGVKTIMTEKQLREDMGDFILMGRIDRIDEHPDGTLEVIDYKSGRLSTSEEEVRHDLAMGIYQLLLKKKNPDRRITGSILCLRTNCKATVELSEEELNEIEEGVRAVAEKILQISEESDIEPQITELCEGCRFERLCKRRITRQE
jgi:RecB family exonuclease